ncbi:hypothetical protein JHD46_02040 [Sulfurimonas sp. SAG-AH-194-C20]|nr:hypothetical protein [Sulfurimonas sp. SAG-AH-194-C20]MDF1878416.1 hypothetical protein [Sulfurimonas sp. SAG-AH-194-C20]
MWSDELKTLTRKMLSEVPMAMMKNVDLLYGVLLLEDDKYVITDRTSSDKYVFETIDELLAAGWAVD